MINVAVTAMLLLMFHNDDVPQEERAVIASRRSIRSLECTVDGDWRRPDVGEKSWKSRIWLDGDKLREDRVSQEGAEEIREVFVRTPDEYIWWTSDTLGGRGGVAIHRWRGNGKEIQSFGHRPIDPRLFGLGADSVGDLASRTFDDMMVGSLDRHGLEVALTEFDGNSVREIKFKRANDVLIRILISNEGHRDVVYLEAVDKRGARQWVKVDHNYYRRGDMWFPSRCVYQNVSSQGKVVSSDGARISVESVNQPIDPKVFTLAGMDLPRRKLINDQPPDPRGNLYWDGEKEVVGVPFPLLEEDESTSPWIYRVAIISCVVIAAVAMWMYARRRP